MKNRMGIACGLICAVALGTSASDAVTETGKSHALQLSFESTSVVTGRDVTCAFALKELNEIAKKATGQTFCLQPATSKNRTSHRIFLGRTPAAEKIIGLDFFEGGARYERETSCVFARGNDLYLVGSDPAGTLWAVYDFCEDSIGYRWYQMCRDDLREENEIVPKAECVSFNGVPTRRRPGFDGFRGDHESASYFRLFRLRHRSNRAIAHFVPGFRHFLDDCTWGHGFDLFFPRRADHPWMKVDVFPEEIKVLAPAFEKHPEWFSMDKNGKRTPHMQMCLSSKVTREALWQSLMWWVKKNGKGLYVIGSNDEHTGTYCYCKECLALDVKFGGQCGALWDCLVEICNRLKASKMDGVYITSLAYRHQTQLCPPGIVFPDNFICDLAPVTWDRTLSEVPDEKLSNRGVYNWLGNCREWCKASPGGVSYWYYGTDTSGYTWSRLSKELREIYDAGVRSAGLCAREGGPEFGDLMHHMWFWCLYYPHGDARAEFMRACRTKYGPAADDLVAYTDVMEKIRQRVVASTPVGPGGVDLLGNASADELRELQDILTRATSKAEGTRYAENVSWARISFDVFSYLKTGDASAEARARTAATSYHEKVGKRKLMKRINGPVQSLDVMANYANLKSDALPPELAKYPRDRVTRVLPPKSAPYSPSGYPKGKKMWSVPDPKAVSGFAMMDEIPDDFVLKDIGGVRVALYDHGGGKYLIGLDQVKIPKGFWSDGEYKLLCMGRSPYAQRTVVYWSDDKGSGALSLGASPLATPMLSRLRDPVVLDQQYETWISARAEGPMFIPGDKRPNRIFVDQLFSVKL